MESPPVSEPSPSVPISIAAAVVVPAVPSSSEDSSPPPLTPEPSPSPPESRKGVPRWERRLPRRLVVAALGSERSLRLKVELDTVNTQETIAVTALVDSGATGCFLDIGFVEALGRRLRALANDAQRDPRLREAMRRGLAKPSTPAPTWLIRPEHSRPSTSLAPSGGG